MAKQTKNKSASDQQGFSELLEFLKSKIFLKNLMYIFAFLLLMLFLTLMWLRFYTNHGQKLELPNYEGMQIEEASKDAQKKSFEIVVNDSIHIVGKPGGEILDQNPDGGTQVKEGRKIYVDVTKYNADQILLSKLPTLYGNNYDQKRKELAYHNINSNIRARKFDPGEPNHILEVWFKGDLIISSNVMKKGVEIEKGGTLDFVISERGGGETPIPDLSCLTLGEARFIIDSNKLKIGQILTKEEITNEDNAYILSQNPPFDGVTNITMGSTIDVTIVQAKPSNCGN